MTQLDDNSIKNGCFHCHGNLIFINSKQFVCIDCKSIHEHVIIDGKFIESMNGNHGYFQDISNGVKQDG